MDQHPKVGQWADVVRRARLDGVVRGVHKGSAVKGALVKGVALALASYADADGGSVRPGTARIAVDCEISYQVAKRCVAALRELGLITVVRQGNRQGQADEYRLTLPADLLDRVDVPDPDAYRALVDEIAAAANRGKRVRVTSSPVPESGAVPVQVTGSPVRQQETRSVRVMRSPVPSGTGDASTGDSDASTGDPVTPVRVTGSPPTYQEHQPPTTTHTRGDLRTDLTVVRARAAGDDVDRGLSSALTGDANHAGAGTPPGAGPERARRSTGAPLPGSLVAAAHAEQRRGSAARQALPGWVADLAEREAPPDVAAERARRGAAAVREQLAAARRTST